MTLPDKTNFTLVFALWFAGLGAAGQFAKISVVFPWVQTQYADAGAGVGFVVSCLSFIGIALGLAAGLLVASLGFRRLLIWALILGAAISVWQMTLPSFGWMLASRILEGISHLVIVVAAPTLIAQVCTDRHRAGVMTLWGSFFGVTFAIFAVVGIPLVEARGLGSLFAAHGIFMAAVALALALLLPKQRDVSGRAAISVVSILKQHITIYRSPRLSAAGLGWLFYTMTFVAMLTILPDYVDPNQRQLTAGAMPLAGIVVSLTLGMALLRYFRAVHVVQLGFALATLVAVLMAFTGVTAFTSIALLACLGLVQGASFAAIPQLNTSLEDQAMANGAMAQMGNLGNSIGTPIMLVVIGMAGFAGLTSFVILALITGLLVHVIQGYRRR